MASSCICAGVCVMYKSRYSLVPRPQQPYHGAHRVLSYPHCGFFTFAPLGASREKPQINVSDRVACPGNVSAISSAEAPISGADIRISL